MAFFDSESSIAIAINATYEYGGLLCSLVDAVVGRTPVNDDEDDMVDNDTNELVESSLSLGLVVDTLFENLKNYKIAAVGTYFKIIL